MASFGETIRRRRKEVRLGLREFAQRCDVDPGNLSKIERGRLNPPQDPNTLDRICRALELDLGDDLATELHDLAAVEAGRIPPDLLNDDAVVSKIPVLLRTVKNKQLDEERMEKLIEIIRKS